HGAMERFRVESFRGIGEVRADRREQMAPEGEAPPDMILPQPRLGFVQSHARRIAQNPVAVFGREALVVEAVAALVQCREQCRRKIILAHADRKANVVLAGEERERVRRAVEATALELESDVTQSPPAQFPLTGFSENTSVYLADMARA